MSGSLVRSEWLAGSGSLVRSGSLVGPGLLVGPGSLVGSATFIPVVTFSVCPDVLTCSPFRAHILTCPPFAGCLDLHSFEPTFDLLLCSEQTLSLTFAHLKIMHELSVLSSCMICLFFVFFVCIDSIPFFSIALVW